MSCMQASITSSFCCSVVLTSTSSCLLSYFLAIGAALGASLTVKTTTPNIKAISFYIHTTTIDKISKGVVKGIHFPTDGDLSGGGQGSHNLPLPVPRSHASRTFLSLCLLTPALYCVAPVIMQITLFDSLFRF